MNNKNSLAIVRRREIKEVYISEGSLGCRPYGRACGNVTFLFGKKCHIIMW